MARSRIERSYEILKTYIGTNPTIQDWKRQYDSGRLILNDFQVNYILANHDYQPFTVNRIVKITPEYGQKLQETYGIEFIPTKIKVYDVIGELGRSYHCRIQFRQSLPPMLSFVSRRCFKEDLKTVDYNAVEVDFDSFDKLTEADGRKLKDHQKTAVKFLLANRKAILADSMGLGKEQDVNTLIPTLYGYKRMGDLVVGDQVFGSDGRPCTVLGVFPQGVKDIYEIEFTDGSKTNSGLEHLWIVKDKISFNRGQDWKVLSLREIKDRGIEYIKRPASKPTTVKHNYKFRIPICQPVQYDRREHLIHPYLMGIMLGDGNLCNGNIVISIPDKEIETLDRISSLIREDYTFHPNRSGTCPNYCLVKDRNYHHPSAKNIYNEEVRRLKANVKGCVKFIPDEYKFDSIENRIELLRGLMDSDGYITSKNNKISYSTSSPQLADDIKELVESLGGLATVHCYERVYNERNVREYMVSIRLEICPFYLQRKVGRYTIQPKQRKYLIKSIRNIKYSHTTEAVCIKVDSPDESYLTNDYIVTHNTTSSIVAAMAAEAKHVLIITTASLKSTWKRELGLYNSSDDIEIIKAGRKWDGTKRYTIINYDLVKNFYQVPMEQAMEKQELKNADGTVTEVMVPAYTKDKKTGHLKPKMVKSRKKATIAECMKNSPLYQLTFDCVIIDEAQKLSRNTSIRYKVIEDFLRRSGIKHVFFLTGTPLTNKPTNLYCILKLLDAEIADDYEYYCTRYCGGYKMKLRTGKEVMIANQATNLEELRHKIKHLYIRRLISDLPDMVHKEISTRYYDLDEKQKVRYDQLWDEYVEAQRNIGNDNSESYRQLVEGTLVRQYLAKEMTTNTIELVNELLDDDEKVIIVCTFQDELDIFRKYYGDKCVCYDGRMSDKAKDAAEKAFMNDPKIKVFVGNINAASLGLTLTVARKMVFNSYSWEEIANRQMQDRIWRITQTDDVECIYQLYTDSISQHMFNSVIRKGMIMDEVIKTEKEKNKP